MEFQRDGNTIKLMGEKADIGTRTLTIPEAVDLKNKLADTINDCLRYGTYQREQEARAREREQRIAAAAIPVDREARQLSSGLPVTDDHLEIQANGQQKGYVVLTEAERAKGFVRPVRQTYKHVGPKIMVVDGDGQSFTRGSACNTTTTMGIAIAETYARDPGFYSGTFCSFCRSHFPLEQFVWDGTDEQVGS